jgi:hypothetical protein
MNPQSKLWKQIPQQATGYNSIDKLLFASLLKFESHYDLSLPLHYIGFKDLFDPFCGDSSSDLQAAAQF